MSPRIHPRSIALLKCGSEHNEHAMPLFECRTSLTVAELLRCSLILPVSQVL